MGEDYYIPRLDKAGIRVLVPGASEMETVNRIIYGELCRGVALDSSRETILGMILAMQRRGAEGIILGCTELDMLLKDGVAEVPLFDTVLIHCAAAVKDALA